jgi:3alpha(or 20beta)-hydroxysteroid dehydrogenase
VHLDVTSEADWSQAVQLAESQFGKLDVLVNNAGIGIPPHPLLDSTFAEHRRTLDVNLDGVWLGMRAAAPAMQRAGGGSIVNISSIDGIVGVAGMTSYAASKFAVTGMTKSAALEWGRDGIRVNSVHPGVISSPMVDHAPPEVRARLQTYLDRQPIARMGTPEEVALLVLYLASDESSYCTGAEFVIDGGHLAGPWREPPQPRG